MLLPGGFIRNIAVNIEGMIATSELMMAKNVGKNG